MAKITIALQSASFTRSKEGRVPDAAVDDILDHIRAAYGQIDNPPDPVTGVVTRRDMTNDEAWDRFAGGIIQGIADNVLNFRREKVTKVARDGVATVPVT